MNVAEKIAAAAKSSRFETPCYVYDIDTILERVQLFYARLGTSLVMSLKANPCLDMVLRVHHTETPIEVASLRELNIANRCSRIYVNTPAMDRNLIAAALGARATIILDSLAQLDDVAAMAGTRSVKPLMLRLNACVLERYQPLPASFRPDQFGMDWATALAAVDRIRASDGRFALAGFHLFTGSHSFARFAMPLAESAPAMIAELEERYGQPITTVNLGGGFSEHWEDETFDFPAYRRCLDRIPSRIEVLHESGRGLLATSGAFLTAIIRTKMVGEHRYAICDGGINQSFLLCRTENRFRKPLRPRVLRAAEPGGDTVRTILVGNSCSRDDVIGEVDGPPLRVGDLCLFEDCGAYHSTYTVAPFLGLREAQHYVIP